MPRTSSLKEKTERAFLSLYIRDGAKPEVIPLCEKRAHLRSGEGKKLLRRKSVKQYVSEELQKVAEEQTRQKIIGEAVAKAAVVQQEQLKDAIADIRLRKLDRDVILDRLMYGVVGLNMHQHPDTVLNYIKTALVVEQERRTIDNPSENAPSVYQSVFRRLAPPSQSPPVLEAPSAKGEAFDLYPGKTIPPVELSGPIPPPGEAIEESPASPSNPNVITVEIG